MTRHFYIPGDPRGKERPRGSHGHMYTPMKTRNYEKAVRYYYTQQCHHDPFQKGQALSVTIRAVFKPPESTPKKRLRDMLLGILFPTKKPDWDNIGKIVTDSLNKICYYDDSQITTAHVYKRYGIEAGVEVWIEEEKI